MQANNSNNSPNPFDHFDQSNSTTSTPSSRSTISMYETPIRGNIVPITPNIQNLTTSEIFKSKCVTKSLTKVPQFDINNSNMYIEGERYMSRLFFEILKMAGLRGYSTLPFQEILDFEKRNNSFIRRGEHDKVVKMSDEQVADFVRNKYLQYGLQVEGKSLRSQFNSIFFSGDKILVVFFAEDENGKAISKDIAVSFVKLLRKIWSIFYKTTFLSQDKMRAIFISKPNLTPGNQTVLSSVPIIDHFLDTNILCSISDNVFCSKREILNPEDRKKFEYYLGVSISKIPSIVRSKDISYQFYGIEDDTVVKETRDSIFPEAIVPTSISYRYCKPEK